MKTFFKLAFLFSSFVWAQTPANYQAILDIDQHAWQTCGACGNSGGSGALARYGATIGANQESEDGFDTNFWIVPNGRYENAYFWQEHPAPTGPLLYLSYEFDLFVPQGQETAPQAIEWEFQLKQNGWIYNGGWQADYAQSEWRTFDYVSHEWKATTIEFTPFSPGIWHHVAVEYHTDAVNHLTFFDSLQVDGKKTWLNLWHQAFAQAGPSKFTSAFQLDGNSSGTPYNVFVDKMELRVVSATAFLTSTPGAAYSLSNPCISKARK